MWSSNLCHFTEMGQICTARHSQLLPTLAWAPWHNVSSPRSLLQLQVQALLPHTGLQQRWHCILRVLLLLLLINDNVRYFATHSMISD